MPRIIAVNRAGQELALSVPAGRTVMELLREHGAVEAACGGQCVCATCHIHVAPEWIAVVGEALGVEQELLDCSLERRPNSRLSCQIVITDALDGFALTVAPAEG